MNRIFGHGVSIVIDMALSPYYGIAILGMASTPYPSEATIRITNMGKILKPGQPAPTSGIYDMVGPKGGATGEQVVSTQHKPLPPTQKPGQGFVVAKPAHHQPKK